MNSYLKSYFKQGPVNFSRRLYVQFRQTSYMGFKARLMVFVKGILIDIEETALMRARGFGRRLTDRFSSGTCRPLIEFHNQPAKTNPETLKIQPSRRRKRNKLSQR